MSKGFLWFCQNNNTTDYVKLSIHLAESLKKHNKENQICVVTDGKTKIESKFIDVVKVVHDDESKDHDVKWANEYKAFFLSPFTHTIKLAADMLWTQNTDWWWNFLWQHDMVFAVDCYTYKNVVTKKQMYRPFHRKNVLPNLYSDLTYFRKSVASVKFGRTCEAITKNWKAVRETMLKDCHDKYPSTDVVYALAHRIVDPTQKSIVDYPWFKFIHTKKSINELDHTHDYQKYLMPLRTKDSVILGSYKLTRPWHYVDKNTMEDINARVF